MVLVLASMQAWSEIYYIREGATGTGSTWADAYRSFGAAGLVSSSDPSVRGNTYYVADGNYESITLSNPQSGSDRIVIKKATALDHGTSVGWSVSYGDGQAVLGSELNFYTSYVEVNGNGNHSVPSDNPNAYGFSILHDSALTSGGIVKFGRGAAAVSNIILRYTHVHNTHEQR